MAGHSRNGPSLSAARQYVSARVAIDTRSLAAVRILLGLTVIGDVLLRVRHFTYFYTSDGVVTAAHTLDDELLFSLFHLSDDPTFAAVFFLLYALVAVQFLLGWHTRVATVVLFLFVVSLHHRNPLVLNYGDRLLRLLLLWAIFLPLGERWSVDAVRSSRTPRPDVASLASALILCQVVALHFVNGYQKATEAVWFTDPAVAYILGRDNTTFFLGNAVREFTPLLRVVTLVWVFALLAAWALLVFQGRERTVFALFFVGFHASLLVTRPMSIAPPVAIAGLVLFLQASFWQDIRSLTSLVGVDRSWYPRMRAWGVRLATIVPVVSVPAGGLDGVRRGTYYGGLFVAVVVVLLAPFLLWMGGLSGMDGQLQNATEEVFEPLDETADVFGVSQSTWGMHSSPSPMDRYYVFAAETTDGEFVDVYNDRALDFQRPSATLSGHYESHRHRKHMSEVRSDTDGQLREALGEHLCDSWSDEHHSDLEYVNVYTVVESFDLDSVADPDERDTWFSHLYTHSCTDEVPLLLEPEDDGENFARNELASD